MLLIAGHIGTVDMIARDSLAEFIALAPFYRGAQLTVARMRHFRHDTRFTVLVVRQMRQQNAQTIQPLS